MRINISAKRRNTLRIPSDKGIFRPKRAFLGDNSSAPFGYTSNTSINGRWSDVSLALSDESMSKLIGVIPFPYVKI